MIKEQQVKDIIDLLIKTSSTVHETRLKIQRDIPSDSMQKIVTAVNAQNFNSLNDNEKKALEDIQQLKKIEDSLTLLIIEFQKNMAIIMAQNANDAILEIENAIHHAQNVVKKIDNIKHTISVATQLINFVGVITANPTPLGFAKALLILKKLNSNTEKAKEAQNA